MTKPTKPKLESVSSGELRVRLSKHIGEVHFAKGKRVKVILKHGKPVAVLVPLELFPIPQGFNQ